MKQMSSGLIYHQTDLKFTKTNNKIIREEIKTQPMMINKKIKSKSIIIRKICLIFNLAMKNKLLCMNNMKKINNISKQ